MCFDYVKFFANPFLAEALSFGTMEALFGLKTNQVLAVAFVHSNFP